MYDPPLAAAPVGVASSSPPASAVARNVRLPRIESSSSRDDPRLSRSRGPDVDLPQARPHRDSEGSVRFEGTWSERARYMGCGVHRDAAAKLEGGCDARPLDDP